MPSITFQPSGLVVECALDESIYEVAWRAGAALSSACGAKATCGLCRVKILQGEGALTPIGEPDKRHLGNVYFITKVRLGCQARITKDEAIVVEPVGAAKKKP